MATVQQNYSTQSPIGTPRYRVMPPERDLDQREVVEPTDRDLLQPLFGQDTIPSRPFTASEHEAITLLRAILQEGRWTGRWADLSFGVDPDLAQRVVDDFAGDTVRGLGLLGPDQVLELFGQGIHLGPERLVFLQAQLANQRAVRAQLARKLSHQTVIELHFVPAENTMVDSIYEQEPRFLGAWRTNDPSAPLRKDAFEEVLLGDYLRTRSGRWDIGVSGPLRAPIELAEDPSRQLKGWVIDVPDRVSEGLNQLDRPERSAVLAALWEVQRHGEHGLGNQVKRVAARDTFLYVLRPTPEIRVIMRPMTPTKVRLVEIVRAKTLKMFREQ